MHIILFVIAMLTRAEIPYEEGVGPDDHTGITLTVTRDSETIIGYTGFFTTIHFDGDGNLHKIGVWE